jgi:hypothetical protein
MVLDWLKSAPPPLSREIMDREPDPMLMLVWWRWWKYKIFRQ